MGPVVVLALGIAHDERFLFFTQYWLGTVVPTTGLEY